MLKTRLWPVLVSPTPNQAEKIRHMKAARTKNTELVTRLTSMRTRIQELEKEIMENHQKTAEYVYVVRIPNLCEVVEQCIRQAKCLE